MGLCYVVMFPLLYFVCLFCTGAGSALFFSVAFESGGILSPGEKWQICKISILGQLALHTADILFM